MKVFLDCIPCFLKQALEAARFATKDEELQKRCLKTVLKKISNISWYTSPPHIGRFVHNLVKEICENPDPYRDIKKRSNEIANSLYGKFKNMILNSEDPFEMALKFSLIGNVIDFGARPGELKNIEQEIEEFINIFIPSEDFLLFKQMVYGAKNILFLGDNAGEIVLDRFLLQQIGYDKLTYVVKEKPIINDATMEDAEETGLTEVVKVITNGTDCPGTPLNECSDEFLDKFYSADLIISKGQGNYETLSDVKMPIFFLLKVKCPVIARDIKRDVGSFVVLFRGM